MNQKFLYLLIISVCIFCQPFKILEKTSQDWSGGTEESGFGTSYRFKMIAKKGSGKLVIDRLWVGKDYFEVKPYLKPGFFNNSTFHRKDTIRILATKFKGSEQNKERNIDINSSKYVKPPFEYEGDAILGYMIKNKRKYKKIESLTRLEKLNYR